MIHARISGTGSYLPTKVIANADIEKLVDTSDQWIIERTGIHSRRQADDSETTTSMALQASMGALEAAELDPQQIDMILFATCSAEFFFPSSACQLQQALGIKRHIPAFDLSAACAGFIYAMTVAEQFIRTGSARHVLIVGSEIMSRTVDWNDRGTCILFGDGAGAAILSASEKPGILASCLHADGNYQHLLQFENHCVTKDPLEPSYVKMRGNEVFKLAVTALGQVVEEILEKSGLSKQDVDWLIPHQANLRIIKATAKKLAMPLDRVILTVAEHGNTSSASVPLALDQGIREGRIQRGDSMLLEAFGGGLTWGASLIRY